MGAVFSCVCRPLINSLKPKITNMLIDEGPPPFHRLMHHGRDQRHRIWHQDRHQRHRLSPPRPRLLRHLRLRREEEVRTRQDTTGSLTRIPIWMM